MEKWAKIQEEKKKKSKPKENGPCNINTVCCCYDRICKSIILAESNMGETRQVPQKTKRKYVLKPSYETLNTVETIDFYSNS